MRHLVLASAMLVGLTGCGNDEQPRSSAPAAPAPAVEAVETVDLSPRFTAGETSTYIQQELRLQGQRSSLHNAIRQTAEVRVFDLETLEATAEGVRLRLTMRRVGATLSENGVLLYRYDSAQDRGDRGLSEPSRAREMLASLVAEARVSPEGEVLSMSANLTQEQVLSLPNSLRPLLAENWARGVIESIFRPYGETRAIPVKGAAERSAAAQSPLEGTLEQEIRLSERGENAVSIESETVLRGPDGEARPEIYRQRTAVAWSLEGGRVDELLRREEVRLERVMAGVDAVELIDRRFFINRVDSPEEMDETETIVEDLLGPAEPAGAESPAEEPDAGGSG